MAIIPCDDCGTPIEVGHLGKRRANDKFVCNKCKPKYTQAMKMLAMIEKRGGTVH